MDSSLRRGGRRNAGFIRQLLRDGTVCRACRRNHYYQRGYASAVAAAATVAEPATTTEDQVSSALQSSTLRPFYLVKTGVLLTRPPQITRDLTPFEKAFFLYQRRLNERLALPFTRYFYYQKGTPADLEWKRKMKERQTAARDIGFYNAYSKEGWNDEVLVGAQESEPEHQVEALLKDAETTGTGSEESSESKRESIPRPMPRVTEADRAGDEGSLARRLDRTLYLLGKETGRGLWSFPTAELAGRESLHHAAERIIVQAGGVNMNTWVVGNAPVGRYTFHYPRPRPMDTPGFELKGEQTFFMKAKIMAGQPNIEGNQLGLTDIKWLCKEEIQKMVRPGYWSSIKDMLAER